MPTNYELAQTFTPDDLRDMALNVAEHYGIPKDMFLGKIAVESNWNPTAKNPESSAAGLNQFIDSTAEKYFKDEGAISKNAEDPNDPRWHPGYSMDAAARYLKDLYAERGSWEGALQGYYGSKTPGANQAYVEKIKEAAAGEADEYEHFRQGQFMQVAGAADVGFGLSPVAEDHPQKLYEQVREYLGLNTEPWKPSPVLQKIFNDFLQSEVTPYAGMTPEEQDSANLSAEIAGPAALGISGEDLLYPDWRRKDIVESEIQRVMGRFVDGYTAGLTEGAKKAAFGDVFKPETNVGMVAGEGAYLAGQILGPFKIIKWLTGSYLFPTVSGLRTMTQVLTRGMTEGAVNVGVLMGLSRIIPAMIENEKVEKFGLDVLNSAKSGALVGAAFPLLSLIPGQGAVGTGARMAAGFAAMDYMQAAPGKWSTLGDFYQAFTTWDEESKKQFTSLAYQYLRDLYFARTVGPLKETTAAYNQNQILQKIVKLNPEELEKEIMGATGQKIYETPAPANAPSAFEKGAEVGGPPTPGEGGYQGIVEKEPEIVPAAGTERTGPGEVQAPEIREKGAALPPAGVSPPPEAAAAEGAMEGGKKETLLYSGGPATAEPLKKAAVAVIEDTANLLKDAPEQIRTAGEKIRDSAKRLWNYYQNPFEIRETAYKDLIKDYLGDVQIAGHKNAEYIKTIVDALPDVTVRKGITNWIQADGNKDLLRQWAEKSQGDLKKGYEAALNLTPEQEVLAREISAKYDYYLQEAQAAEIIEHGLENYVNQMWKKDSHNKTELQKLQAEINAGLLNTNFKYAKKRIFGSYFEGEQAGRIPVNKDIAFLLGHYDQAMYGAIAARRVIKNLTKGQADDGRPLVSVSGAGKQITKPGEDVSFEKAPGEYDMTEAKGPQAYLIRPRVSPEETGDYRYIDHPALRKWKWIDKDPNGAPIFIEGDLRVHPDIYQHLKNILGTSAIRKYALGRAALKVSQNLKGVLLSGLPSGFHQVNLATHAVFHRINPFTCPEIDFSDPVQVKAVKSGLMVYNHRALEQFSEGLHSTGLAAKVPGIGRVTQAYGEYLFQDLIPRYKMKLFKEAYARNLERYTGKYTEDQIAEITANQANAAFGELNYRAMGRNPTMQDTFRLLSLAPDFLEARLRFVGQALKPGGREQSAALLKAAIGMYGVAAIANMILSDDHEGHWDKPFTLVIGKNEYALRSVPGDMIHLISDPRSFVYHRLNPTIAKPLIEFITQRDVYGRLRNWQEQIGDFFRGHVPIPAQGLVSKGERTILQSALQSIGVSSWRYKSSAEKQMTDFYQRRAMLNLSAEERESGEFKRGIMARAREGDQQGFLTALHQARKEGQLTYSQYYRMMDDGREILRDPHYGAFRVSFRKLTDLGEAIKVFTLAKPDERMAIKNLMAQKWENAKDDTRRKYRREFLELREKIAAGK